MKIISTIIAVFIYTTCLSQTRLVNNSSITKEVHTAGVVQVSIERISGIIQGYVTLTKRGNVIEIQQCVNVLRNHIIFNVLPGDKITYYSKNVCITDVSFYFKDRYSKAIKL